MADYWTKFSTAIVLTSHAERNWWEDKLGEVNLEKFECDPAAYDSFEEEWGVPPDYWPGFEHKFMYTNSDPQFAELYIYNQDVGGRLEGAVKLMQEFLRTFNPQGCLAIEAAFVCSKACTDGFGGYAAFISAETVETITTNRWLQKQIDAFHELKGAEPGKVIPLKGKEAS